MLFKKQAVHDAWAATERTLDFKVAVKGEDYTATDISSLSYDSGAMNGEALTLGSTYTNTIKITFSHLIEGLALLDEITPQIGIQLPDGTWDFTTLGVFIIDSEVQQDRNNNTTTVSASDRMCMMGGTYESKLSYPAAINDIAAEIAAMAGVGVNVDDFARLPTEKILSLGNVTYRDAIGYVAQFAGGFATFDRSGLLDIRVLNDPNFVVTPDQYQSKGLTKNETFYRIGGITCNVVRTSKDDSGNETEETTTLQSGSTSGTQITLVNPGMTQILLDGLYQQLQDINFYPFSLSWFGDPALEAGDWITVKDTAGNDFKTPNLLYSLTFGGGVTATSKADTTITAAANFVYKGATTQFIANVRRYLNAAGHAVSEGIDEPTSPKVGDIWFKKEGPDTTIETYVIDPETGIGSWSDGPSTKPNTVLLNTIDQAQKDATAAGVQAGTAVSTANQAVSAAGFNSDQIATIKSDMATAISQASTAYESANTALGNAATALSTAKTASNDASTAIANAATAINAATDAQTKTNTLVTKVNDIAGTIETLATTETVNKLAGTVTTVQNLAQFASDGLKLKADSSTVSTLDGRVTKLSGQLDVQADKIAATVTANDVTGMLGNYATQSWSEGKIIAAKNEISASVETVQTQVQNSAVGTNLIVKSGLEPGYVARDNGGMNSDGAGDFHLDNYIATNGKTIFTFSSPDYTFKGSSNHTLAMYDSGKKYLGYQTITTATQTLSKPNTAYIRFSINFTDEGGTLNNLSDWLSKHRYKLEKGSVATDWCPAPEDVQSGIATAQSTANTAKTDAQTADGKAIDAQNKAVAAQNKANSVGSDLADYKTVVSKTYSTIDQTASSIKLSVETVQKNIANATAGMATQTWTQGKLDLTADGLTSQISSVENGLNEKYTSLEQTLSGVQVTANNAVTQSQLTQTASSLTSTINNLQIGGRNYYSTLSPVDAIKELTTSYAPSVDRNNPDSPNGFKITGAQDETGTIRVGNVITSNGWWTISFWIRGTQGVAVGLTLDACDLSPVKLTTSADNTWQKYVYTVNVTNHDDVHNFFDFSNMSWAWFLIKDFKVEQGNKATDWSPAPEDQATVADVSSQITQLQSDINLRVKTGDLISQINVSAGNVLIQSGKLYLDAASVVMGGTAFINAANIKSVNASTITTGTLDAATVNVVGINASNITTGTINGANLSINLTTGQVLFQKGRIHSTSNSIDINVDQGYVSVANDNARVMLKNGGIQFVQPNVFDVSTNPYLSISNGGSGLAYRGARIVGRDYVVVSNSANASNIFDQVIDGAETFAGISMGYDGSSWHPTKIGGAERGIILSAGQPLSSNVSSIGSPASITIGTQGQGAWGGNRIELTGEYVHSLSTYTKTASGSANVIVSPDGALIRSTSASKYKTDIQRTMDDDYGQKLLDLPTATWLDKADMKRYSDDPAKQPVPTRNFGMIAEDLAAAGLEYLVVRGQDGQLEGIEYDRIGPALIPVIAKLQKRIEILEQLKGEI